MRSVHAVGLSQMSLATGRVLPLHFEAGDVPGPPWLRPRHSWELLPCRCLLLTRWAPTCLGDRHDGDSLTFPSKTGPGSQSSESRPTVNLHPQYRCDQILLRERQEDLLISQIQGQALCNPGEPFSQPRLPFLPGTDPRNLEIAAPLLCLAFGGSPHAFCCPKPGRPSAHLSHTKMTRLTSCWRWCLHEGL